MEVNQFELLSKQQAKANATWKEEAKKAKEANELKECTFAPQITVRRQGKADTSTPFNERLYKIRKLQIEKTDKTKEDYEYEKAKEECTFAPNLTRKPVRA
jgi:uncharacterized protein with ParB-like and HNH nuclease domain